VSEHDDSLRSVASGAGATEVSLPDPVVVENGDVLVAMRDEGAAGGVSMARLSPEDEDYAYWLGQAQQAGRRVSIAEPVRIAGRITILVGCVVLLVSMFVTYLSVGPVSRSLWQATTRMPVILTVIAGTAIILTLVSVFDDRPALILAVAAGSFFALGETFPLIFKSYPFEAGFWLGVTGAAAMSLGSVLVMAVHLRRDGRGSRPATR
jgi:hypothetical protein